MLPSLSPFLLSGYMVHFGLWGPGSLAFLLKASLIAHGGLCLHLVPQARAITEYPGRGRRHHLPGSGLWALGPLSWRLAGRTQVSRPP